MPKSVALVLRLALVALLVFPAPALAATDAEVEALISEVKALRQRVADLEKKLEGTCQVQEEQGQAVAKADEKAEEARRVAKEAEKRARQAYESAGEASTRSIKASRDVEVAVKDKPGLVSELGKNLTIYGQVQVEATHESREHPGGRTVSNSDLSLATAEIFFEGSINKYTRGVLHFLWEEGDTEPVDLDEAFLLIGQTDDMPYYLLAGRIYPAVGLFESYLVSDTITKNLFETQETAAEVGYAGSWFNVSAGLYAGGLQETDTDEETHINSWYGRVQVYNPEGTMGGMELSAGLAYANNIGDAGGLLDQIPDQRVSSLVGGISASFSARYKQVGLLGEYITALDSFKANELDFAGGEEAKPYAFNLELAWMPTEVLVFAVRYEGGGDLYQLEPENQYGVAASWTFLPDTTIALEYLHGNYEGGGHRDLLTTQLTVAY